MVMQFRYFHDEAKLSLHSKGTFEQHVWLLNWNIALNQTSLLPETTSIPHA
jgi:hypothetical protein